MQQFEKLLPKPLIFRSFLVKYSFLTPVGMKYSHPRYCLAHSFEKSLPSFISIFRFYSFYSYIQYFLKKRQALFFWANFHQTVHVCPPGVIKYRNDIFYLESYFE